MRKRIFALSLMYHLSNITVSKQLYHVDISINTSCSQYHVGIKMSKLRRFHTCVRIWCWPFKAFVGDTPASVFFFFHFRLFKRIDFNGDKKIDFREFQDALHDAGVTANLATQKECFSDMDRDGSGTVNFDEFLIALRVPISLYERVIYFAGPPRRAISSSRKLYFTDCTDIKVHINTRHIPNFIPIHKIKARLVSSVTICN